MLTKWGAALGLASAGRVVAGGGGALGDATVWPSVADWASLGTITGPLRTGDQAPVGDLGTAGSYGLAGYDGAVWELRQGVFATVADLGTFSEPIASGALAIVGTGVETDPVYFYDGGQWLRTPDGVHYIWQQAADWSALASVPAPQNNDRAEVQTLGTAHSSGYAERHGGSWKLVQGRFASVADMTGFSEPVHPGAFAEVKAGGGHDDDSVTYVYQSGAWVRFAGLTAGYAWVLTETQLLEGTDPSGIGAVQEGDYGVLAASGGPVVVRYKLVTVAAGTTTGTRAMWIPPAAYAGTNLVLDGYALGTESDAQLVAQGLAVTEVGTGTVSSVGGYIRLDSPSGAGNPEARLNHATITGNKKWALMCQIRGTVTGAAAGLFQPGTETSSQYVLAHNAFSGLTTTVQQLYWTTGWAVASNTFTVRGGGSAWPASTPWLLMAESGAAISDVVETRVDGAVYSTFRRNSDGAGTGTNWTLTPQTVSGVGVSSRLEFKNYFRLVWD